MTPERIARLLPDIWNAPSSATNAGAKGEHGRLLWDMLTAMSALHEPAETALETLPQSVDPLATQDRFVPMLAGWLDLDGYLVWPSGREHLGTPHFPGGIDRLRALSKRAPSLRRRRGLTAALSEFLAIALGIDEIRIEENPGGTRFHIRVSLPHRARSLEELARRIVAEERPAHCTWQVRFDEAPGAAPPDPSDEHTEAQEPAGKDEERVRG